jgi:hypothetical protein
MRRRKMIGVRVRVEHVVDPQPMRRGERQIAIELRLMRVDRDRLAGLLAADQIGDAAVGADGLEEHRRPSFGV